MSDKYIDRVTTREMEQAILNFMQHLPPISEEDVFLVAMNPSLSLFQKIKIIRKCRKTGFKKIKNKKRYQPIQI